MSIKSAEPANRHTISDDDDDDELELNKRVEVDGTDGSPMDGDRTAIVVGSRDTARPMADDVEPQLTDSSSQIVVKDDDGIDFGISAGTAPHTRLSKRKRLSRLLCPVSLSLSLHVYTHRAKAPDSAHHHILEGEREKKKIKKKK